MLGIHGFYIFLASGLLLNITPGADMLYTVSRSSAQGVRAGVCAALGVSTGILVHIAFAVVGLSALLATSATAFAAVKYAGAAYLAYLGLKLLLKRDGVSGGPHVDDASGHATLFQVYRQGLLINVLNPKIALFFLAFLPQFIDPAAGSRALAFLVLGLTFNLTGTAINVVAAWSAHSLRQRMANASTLARWLRRVAGGVFIGLGARLALAASQ